MNFSLNIFLNPICTLVCWLCWPNKLWVDVVVPNPENPDVPVDVEAPNRDLLCPNKVLFCCCCCCPNKEVPVDAGVALKAEINRTTQWQTLYISVQVINTLDTCISNIYQQWWKQACRENLIQEEQILPVWSIYICNKDKAPDDAEGVANAVAVCFPLRLAK